MKNRPTSARGALPRDGYSAHDIALLARMEAGRLRRLASDGAISAPIGPSAWANFLDSVADVAEAVPPTCPAPRAA